jgi:Protein of unknown function (DUF3309)
VFRVEFSHGGMASLLHLREETNGGKAMITLLILILLLLALGALPSWPYSRGWGYYPSGGLTLLFVILLLLALSGRL